MVHCGNLLFISQSLYQPSFLWVILLDVVLIAMSIIAVNMTSKNTTIACLRCTDLCLQCNVDGATCRLQSPCCQCNAAGIDFCTFPPSIYRDNPQSNSQCLSCIENKTKCLFANSSDRQCIRCTKQHLHCCFKLKGKWRP